MGTRQEAYNLACLDDDQHTIVAILAHMGRTAMQFLVQFADNVALWLPPSRDLSNSIPFCDYCQSIPYLYIISLTIIIAYKFISDKRNEDITTIAPGDHVWVNLRFFGASWYDSLPIEDKHLHDYYVEFIYGQWSGSVKNPHPLDHCRHLPYPRL